MTDDPDDPPIEVRSFREGDEVLVLEMLRTEFVDRDAARLRWQYLGAPETRRLMLGFSAGRLIRILGDTHYAGYVDGEPALVGVCSDWIAIEDPHRRALATVLEADFFGAHDEVDLCLGFPRPEAAEVSVKRYGSRILGVMPQWVRWHTGDGVEASRPGMHSGSAALVALSLRARAGLGGLRRRLGGHRVAVHELASADEARAGLDELADRSRSAARVVRRRDSDYLQWRWLDQPARQWHLAVATRSGAVAGFVAYGLDPDEPSVGRVVDLFACDPSTVAAVADHAARQLARDGAGRTVCELIDPRPWSGAAMRAAGFLPRGEGPMVMGVRTPLGPIEGEPGSFYLTFGDTDLC